MRVRAAVPRPAAEQGPARGALLAAELQHPEHGGARGAPARHGGAPRPAGHVLAARAQLHVPAQDVPRPHLPARGVPRGPALLLLGQGRDHRGEDPVGHLRRLEPPVAHRQALHDARAGG